MTRIVVTLRVRGVDLDPAVVTAAAGISPTHEHRRGDVRSGSNGRVYAPFKEGLWALDSSRPEIDSLESHVMDVVDRVDRDAIARFLEEGHVVDVLVGIFVDDGEAADLVLSPAAVRHLGERRLELQIAIYSTAEGESIRRWNA